MSNKNDENINNKSDEEYLFTLNREDIVNNQEYFTHDDGLDDDEDFQSSYNDTDSINTSSKYFKRNKFSTYDRGVVHDIKMRKIYLFLDYLLKHGFWIGIGFLFLSVLTLMLIFRTGSDDDKLNYNNIISTLTPTYHTIEKIQEPSYDNNQIIPKPSPPAGSSYPKKIPTTIQKPDIIFPSPSPVSVIGPLNKNNRPVPVSPYKGVIPKRPLPPKFLP